MRSGIQYRIWQFFRSLKGSLTDQDWQEIKKVLSPAELELFRKLPVPDQNHSLRVYRELKMEGKQSPDLMKAALLHDLGKIRYPLKRWERVLAVLVKAFFPARLPDWSQETLPWRWRKPLVVMAHHPAWGAELAREAGSDPRTVWLIMHHEGRNIPDKTPAEDLELLAELQQADSQN